MAAPQSSENSSKSTASSAPCRPSSRRCRNASPHPTEITMTASSERPALAVLSVLLFSTASFAQLAAPSPNLPAQKIRPSALVGVSVYGEPDLTRTVRVGADGTLRLPMLKEKIKADGLMPEELERAIVDALKSQEILVDPFVTVTVAEYHLLLPISVAGAVRTPITFQPVEKVTLLEAITRAGGLSPEAGSEILVAGPKSPVAADGAPAYAAPPLVRRILVKSLI